MSLEGQQLGRYRLLRPLGSGNMGEVYLAEDPRINQQVAIKVVRTEASAYPDSEATQNAARLFEREARTIARLDHPNILALSDFGEQNVNGAAVTYIVMPFRKEGSLTNWLRQRGSTGLLSPEEVAYIVQQAADALQHAHDNGVIHQDVKPANFLIRERRDMPNRPDVLLADFGIAKLTTATATASQSVRGTPVYMAPEQWEGHPVPATDQYALAVMAYELLTGRPPFQGRLEQMMLQHFSVQATPPSAFNPRVPRDLDSVILHALAKKPEERFASVAAFGRAFQQAAAVQMPQSPPSPPSPQPSRPNNTPLERPKGNDIAATLAISAAEAQSGTTRTLTLPGGRTVFVSVPAGAYNGQVLRLEGQGELPTIGGLPSGALLLTLTIQSRPLDADAQGIVKTVLASNPNIAPPPPAFTASPPSTWQNQTVPGSNPNLQPPTLPASNPNWQNPTVPASNASYANWQAPTAPVANPNQNWQNPTATIPNPYLPNQTIPSSPPFGNLKGLSSGQIALIVVVLLVLIGGSIGAFFIINGQQTAARHARETQTVIVLQNDQTAAASATAFVQQANNAAAATASAVAATASAVAATSSAVPSVSYPSYLPGSGTLSASDPLDGSSSGANWSTGSGCHFTGGVYDVTEQQTGQVHECFAQNSHFSNFAVEVSMTINSGDCGGIVLRANASQLYLLDICLDGSYNLYRYDSTGGFNATLAQGPASVLTISQGQAITIDVVANGSSFAIFAGGQHVDSGTDGMYSQGEIGLIADAPTNTTDVSYSKLIVWTL